VCKGEKKPECRRSLHVGPLILHPRHLYECVCGSLSYLSLRVGVSLSLSLSLSRCVCESVCVCVCGGGGRCVWEGGGVLC
jgi:hypothetical protein